MAKFRKIGILTSGGDAPGMNAAVRAVAREAMHEGVQVVGIREGYQGLIEGNVFDMTTHDVSGIITHGGTVLYSSRSPMFMTDEGMKMALKTCEEYQTGQPYNAYPSPVIPGQHIRSGRAAWSRFPAQVFKDSYDTAFGIYP